MSTFDIMNAAGVVVSFVWLAGHTKTRDEGVVGNLIDGNSSTEYGVYRYSHSPDMTYRIQIRFPEVTSLTNVAIVSNTHATYSYPYGWTKCYVVYANGSRALIGEHHATYPGGQAVNFNVSTGWRDVVGIDFEGRRAYFRRTSQIQFTISEIELLGYIWDDIGLRYYDGSNIKKIFGKTLESTDKIRISKNGTVYGIPLVTITDALASNIRIKIGSTVYALAAEIA